MSELQAMIEAHAARQEEIADLVELADSKPEYKLAVVEIRADEPSFWKPTKRRVVKMEGE